MPRRPLRRLPDAWYEPGAAERMAAWIERFVPKDERKEFTYGGPRWTAQQEGN